MLDSCRTHGWAAVSFRTATVAVWCAVTEPTGLNVPAKRRTATLTGAAPALIDIRPAPAVNVMQTLPKVDQK